MARVDRERFGMRGIERRKAYERRRPLMLKLRVVPKAPMSKRMLLDAIDRSVDSGVLDPRIEIHVADWAKATVHGQTNTGTLPPPLHRELWAFREAMRAAREGRGTSRVSVQHTQRRVRMERAE